MAIKIELIALFLLSMTNLAFSDQPGVCESSALGTIFDTYFNQFTKLIKNFDPIQMRNFTVAEKIPMVGSIEIQAINVLTTGFSDLRRLQDPDMYIDPATEDLIISASLAAPKILASAAVKLKVSFLSLEDVLKVELNNVTLKFYVGMSKSFVKPVLKMDAIQVGNKTIGLEKNSGYNSQISNIFGAKAEMLGGMLKNQIEALIKTLF